MLCERIVREGIKIAKTAPGLGARKNFRVGAVLFNRKEILARGINQRKTHPKLKRYYQWPFLHAESSCILKHGMDNCQGLSLLVIRILQDGSCSMAMPCDCCSVLLREVGIKEIYYTDWKGQIRRQ